MIQPKSMESGCAAAKAWVNGAGSAGDMARGWSSAAGGARRALAWRHTHPGVEELDREWVGNWASQVRAGPPSRPRVRGGQEAGWISAHGHRIMFFIYSNPL
jgi:hypothetical protein